jgi:cytochrome P450
LTFPRRVKTPISVDGYQLEPGTVVMGSIYLTHHREDIYPNSKQFNPERFIEKQFSPYQFIPFGAGARRCIGLAFAQFEMKLALAKILQGWEMELADTREVKPKRRGLVTGQDKPIQMIYHGRRQQQSRTLETIAV